MVQSLAVKVFPETSAPPVEGILVNIDGDISDWTFNGKTGEMVTVRASETQSAHGFQWTLPIEHEWKCVTLVDDNFGDFNVGYRQFLFEITSKVNCEEKFTIKRAQWAIDAGMPAEQEISIVIEGTGEVTTPVTDRTMVVESSVMNYRIGMMQGEKITLTEESASGEFQWEWPTEILAPTTATATTTEESCVSVVNS